MELYKDCISHRQQVCVVSEQSQNLKGKFMRSFILVIQFQSFSCILFDSYRIFMLFIYVFFKLGFYFLFFFTFEKMIACGLWKTWNKVQIKVTKHLYHHIWLEYSNVILLCYLFFLFCTSKKFIEKGRRSAILVLGSIPFVLNNSK